MGSKSPAFQFYPKDWLSSLNVLMMTPAEEGAYIRLLCYCWDSGDCSIPDDDDALAAMSRLGEGWLKGGSSKLRKCFIAHPEKPGFLTNERMLKERRSQAEWSRKSSEGGKRSAAQRAEKKRQSKGGSGVVEPDPNRPVQPKANSASASASPQGEGEPSPPPTPRETPKGGAGDLLKFTLPDWIPPDLWGEFLAIRKKLGAVNSIRALEAIVRKLDGWRGQGHDPTAVIEKSITSSWKDVFEPKENHHAKPNNRPVPRHTDFASQDFRANTGGFVTD